MRKKSDDNDAGAMDSLLDTMTNVVGILVIVLVVTQLGVSDAVDRVSASIDVDPEALKANQARLVQLDQQRASLTTKLESLDPENEHDDNFLEEEIEALKKRLEERDLKFANLNKKNIALQQSLVLGEKEKEEQATQRKMLEEEIASSLSQAAKIRASLEETPDREIVPPKEMRLPDPRPAPEGTRPFQMICYKNKIYPFQFHPIREEALVRAKALLSSKKFAKIDPKKGIDGDRFVQEFNRKTFRNEFFEIEMRQSLDGYPNLACVPRERAGANLRDVERKNSQFSKDILATDPTKVYFQFYVCGDSYDIYLSARALAEGAKIAVGWIPQPTDWVFVGRMSNEIRFGVHKPVKPNPNPPANTKPKKPGNLID